jgi:hypothetical protein
VTLLTTAYIFSFIDKYLPALLVEPIKASLGVSDSQMGLLLGPAFAVLYATLGLPLGWASGMTDIAWPLVGRLEPWQFTFLALGLPGLLVALLLAVCPEPARDPTTGTGGASIAETLCFLRTRWRPFASLTAVVCVMTIIAYSQNWYAALFQREFGWTLGRYALWSGLALIIQGPLVVNLTGWWCDRWSARGRSDAPLLLTLIGTVLLVPTGIAAPLMASGELCFAVWLLNLGGLSIVSAAAPVAVLAITPGAMRGQVSALFYMVIMLTGLVVGPLAVGLVNDLAFAGNALGIACAVVAAAVGLPGLLLLAPARRMALNPGPPPNAARAPHPPDSRHPG